MSWQFIFSRLNGAPSRRVSRVGAAAVALLLASMLVTGCSEWWVPQAGKSPGADEAAASVMLAPPVLGASAETMPANWNATAKANGSDAVLSDPLVANDSLAGQSTAMLALGDYTLTIQWRDDNGELSFAQLDGPMESPPEGSELALVGESLVAGTLGLDAAASKTLVQDLIKASVAESADPTTASGSVTSGPATVTFDWADGSGVFYVTSGI